jgi:ethanolamine transporter
MEFTISNVIMIIMAVFFAIGAIDRCIGHKIFLGREFERGFGLAGQVALIILGLICIAPVVAKLIAPVIVPAYNFIGADAAMFSATFFAPDCGGYAIGAELSDDPLIAKFGGLIVASVMGAVISFTIPFAYGLIDKADTKFLAVGILAGFIFDPFACFFGGVALGIPPLVVVRNLVPVLCVAVIICIGLYFAPKVMIKIFNVIAKVLLVIITIGLVAATVERFTGLVIIPGMSPMSDAFNLLGLVILILAGSLPLVYTLRLALRRPLAALAKKIGVTDLTIIDMLVSLTSIAATYADYGKMNEKGKVLAAAATASISNCLGAHLGFATAIDPSVLPAYFLAKFTAGIFAIPTAIFFYNRLFGPKSKKNHNR